MDEWATHGLHYLGHVCKRRNLINFVEELFFIYWYMNDIILYPKIQEFIGQGCCWNQIPRGLGWFDLLLIYITNTRDSLEFLSLYFLKRRNSNLFSPTNQSKINRKICRNHFSFPLEDFLVPREGWVGFGHLFHSRGEIRKFSPNIFIINKRRFWWNSLLFPCTFIEQRLTA